MDAKITLNVRSLLLVIMVALAVLAAYTIGTGAGRAPAATAAAEETPPERTIAMTASGEATAVPDQLSFGISVRTRADDISAALDRANRTTRRVLQALSEYGVAKKDVQTTDLSIHPVRTRKSKDHPVVTRYAVAQDQQVLVRSFADAGKAVSAAVEAGGNAVRVHGLTLKVGNTDELIKDARDQAVAAATEKAEQYAAATGRSLGDVTQIREVGAKPRPYGYEEQSGSLDAVRLSKVPISAGSEQLRVTVSVVWDLADS
ncbi:MAG: SIMPL domain-containing protein [Nocardioidaceae bacterium]